MSDIINSNDNYDNQVVSEHTFAGINKYSASQDEMTYFTPEMFGAVGDGVTDDYLAIKPC